MKKIHKRKIREFGKIILFEFPKDLVSDELNMEINKMVDEDQSQDAKTSETEDNATETEVEGSEETEEETETSKAENSETDEVDESEETDGSEAKSINADAITKIMAKAVSDGIAKGMEAVQTNRGLTDKSPAEKMRETLKNASTGELFAAQFMGGSQ